MKLHALCKEQGALQTLFEGINYPYENKILIVDAYIDFFFVLKAESFGKMSGKPVFL